MLKKLQVWNKSCNCKGKFWIQIQNRYDPVVTCSIKSYQDDWMKAKQFHFKNEICKWFLVNSGM